MKKKVHPAQVSMSKKPLTIGFLFMTAVFAGSSFAQQIEKNGKPDFSGTWIFDESKSKDVMKELFKSKPKPANQFEEVTEKVVIEHSEPLIKITEVQSNKIFVHRSSSLEKEEKTLVSKTFYTDKRGETNSDEDSQTVTSETKWDGKQIVIVTLISKEKKHYIVSRLSLSKGKIELTVTINAFQVRYDPTTSKEFYFPLPFSGKKVFKKSN